MKKQLKEKLEIISDVLESIGFRKNQNTELTRITILALLDRTARSGLLKGKSSLHDGARITDILNKFANGELGKSYAENTRETIRKNSLRLLLDNGLIDINKDDPTRATNSGNTNYTITSSFENLINSHGTPNFDKLKSNFYNETEINKMNYINTLKKISIKINIPNSKAVIFSPGAHNVIQKFIVEDLLLQDSNNPHITYIGDTGNKEKIVDIAICELINLNIDIKSKTPDVVAYDEKEKKVLLYEAVANCGPIDSKRKKEIEELFSSCPFKLELYSVFLHASVYQKYSASIAAGTTAFIIEKNMKVKYSSYTSKNNK